MAHVAQLAGVSSATVSRALNGSPKVRDGTRALVEDAAARLGYVPNPAARSLVTGQTNTIALVVSEPETRLFSDPFFPAVVHGIASAIADSDLQLVLLLAHTEHEHGKVERYVRQRHVDGVILMSLHGEDALPRRLVEAGVPTVVSGRPAAAAQPIPYVDADNRGGGRAAADHLLARGAKTIATVTGPLDMTAAVDRYEGYRDALANRPPLVAHADFSVEGGERAMRELLARAPDLDAVFVASDLMAVGALIALRALGRRVPDDVAVVGFDDVPLAAASEPPLTTVRQPLEAITWVYTDQWFDQNLGTAQPTAHFVTDTSRNGQGPWTPPAGKYPDPQDWCNPPGRGLGVRPTSYTGNPLADAILWVKVPGESDGTCTRGAPARSVDPEWGIVDPAAGQWFPQQALQLAQLASPPLI